MLVLECVWRDGAVHHVPVLWYGWWCHASWWYCRADVPVLLEGLHSYGENITVFEEVDICVCLSAVLVQLLLIPLAASAGPCWCTPTSPRQGPQFIRTGEHICQRRSSGLAHREAVTFLKYSTNSQRRCRVGVSDILVLFQSSQRHWLLIREWICHCNACESHTLTLAVVMSPVFLWQPAPGLLVSPPFPPGVKPVTDTVCGWSETL